MNELTPCLLATRLLAVSLSVVPLIFLIKTCCHDISSAECFSCVKSQPGQKPQMDGRRMFSGAKSIRDAKGGGTHAVRSHEGTSCDNHQQLQRQPS